MDLTLTSSHKSRCPPNTAFARLYKKGIHKHHGLADKYFKSVSELFLALQNVVTNVGLGRAVDNRAFTRERPNAYVPSRFEAAAVVRYNHIEQTTILVFNTGCVVVVGSKSSEQTIQAVHRLRLALEAAGVSTGVTDFETVNMCE
jgi:TATA-box binding protein (TBP) (component of TFIID and TFIIIB)